MCYFIYRKILTLNKVRKMTNVRIKKFLLAIRYLILVEIFFGHLNVNSISNKFVSMDWLVSYLVTY